MGIGVLKAGAAQKRTECTPEHEVAEPHSHALSHLSATTSSVTSARSTSPYVSHTPTTYGATHTHVSLDDAGHRSLHSSPERMRRSSSLVLDRVPEDTTIQFDHEGGPEYSPPTPANGEDDESEDEEDAEEELDEELEEQGLYRGSYRRLLVLYTMVPLTAIITFVLVATIPSFAYPSEPSRYPYAPYFPFPAPELLASIAFWCFAYVIRDPIYSVPTSVASRFPSIPAGAPILFSTCLHTLVSLALQQAALPLLLVPHYAFSNKPTVWNSAFKRVWWIALGWAAAEAVAAVKQGYERIALYRDVLVTVHRNDSESEPQKPKKRIFDLRGGAYSPATPKGSGGPNSVDDLHAASGSDISQREFDERDERRPLLASGIRSLCANGTGNLHEIDEAVKNQMDQDIDELLALQSREELEEMYGVPIIRIPVFISCLQRINSILMSLGVCLLLSHAYMCSTLAISYTSGPFFYQQGGTNMPLIITLPVVVAAQFGLAVLHTPLVLPVLGVPTVVYACSLISLGSFFAGLGVWEGLV